MERLAKQEQNIWACIYRMVDQDQREEVQDLEDIAKQAKENVKRFSTIRPAHKRMDRDSVDLDDIQPEIPSMSKHASYQVSMPSKSEKPTPLQTPREEEKKQFTFELVDNNKSSPPPTCQSEVLMKRQQTISDVQPSGDAEFLTPLPHQEETKGQRNLRIRRSLLHAAAFVGYGLNILEKKD